MIQKPGLFAFVFAASINATAAELPDGMQDNESEFYRPFIAMQACADIPPNGYFLTELRYVASSTPCFGKWIYIFESHFDKPAGYQMTICSPTLPWVVPSNWYKVRDAVATTCARRLGDAHGAAWVVQKAG